MFQLCHNGIMVVSCGGLEVVCSNGVAILLWWVFGGFFMVVHDSGLYICLLVVWEWYTLVV